MTQTPTSTQLHQIILNLKTLTALSANHQACLAMYDNGKDLTEDIDKAIEMGTDMILQVLQVTSDLMIESKFFEMLRFIEMCQNAEPAPDVIDDDGVENIFETE
jgi:hypothetical protein